jgi:allantoicase
VEQTLGPNNQVNSYDSARAVSWYKENLTTANNRIFYTSLGHANSNYTSDTLFQKHIRQATEWCLGRINSLQNSSNEEHSFKISPNPSNGFIKLQSPIKDYQLIVYSLDGRVTESYFINESEKIMDLSYLKSGVYLLKFNSSSFQKTQKLIIR